jgi:hypothetical protein
MPASALSRRRAAAPPQRLLVLAVPVQEVKPLRFGLTCASGEWLPSNAGAWRNYAYLALEIGDADIAAYAKGKGQEPAASLARSIRMTSEELGSGLIPGSADREDVDRNRATRSA